MLDFLGESSKPDARIFERGRGTFVYNALFREEPLELSPVKSNTY